MPGEHIDWLILDSGEEMSEEAKPERDAYAAPTLRMLGSVQELTQAAVPGPRADTALPQGDQGDGTAPGGPFS